MKTLYDISWQVPEETYREDKALSYSTLAKFHRTGFSGIKNLFDKIETPSLTFGSAVDSIITGGEKEFESRFMVADFPSIPDSILPIVKALFQTYSSEYNRLSAIPDNIVVDMAGTFNYQNNWRPETRAKVIKEKGEEYYTLMYLAESRTILSTQLYKDIAATVQSLKDSPATEWYFENDNPFDNIERWYQLKFKARFNNVEYRCMADELIVLHDEKRVIPLDLKTSSKPEWEFYKSFVDWDYMIQARLYWRIIRDNMDRDPYYKNFTLENYRFVVANKNTLVPLVWEYEDTTKSGTLIYGKQGNIECPDPFDIGNELNSYLNCECAVPNEISIASPNSLTYWLNKL